jgi:hypothetical protein
VSAGFASSGSVVAESGATSLLFLDLAIKVSKNPLEALTNSKTLLIINRK